MTNTLENNPRAVGISSDAILEAAQSGSDEIILKRRFIPSNSIVYAIVENHRGVLHRVSSMFRAKGFNVASISIGRTSSPDLARMTIVPVGDQSSLALLVKQLRKMIDVIEVGMVSPDACVVRELALLRVEAQSTNSRRELVDLTNALGAKVVDMTADRMVVEMCSTPEAIDYFVEEASKYGILKDMVRTGLTALGRDE